METAVRNFNSIPFSESLLENNYWKPTMESWKTEEEFKKEMDEYNQAEEKVLFEGLKVHWDSCDCGEGWGCEHGSWPYKVTFDYDKEAKINLEDENCMEIVKEGVGHLYFENIREMNVGQFMDACKSLKIELKLKK